jgi:hypothetical protein
MMPDELKNMPKLGLQLSNLFLPENGCCLCWWCPTLLEVVVAMFW